MLKGGAYLMLFGRHFHATRPSRENSVIPNLVQKLGLGRTWLVVLADCRLLSGELSANV